MDEEVAVVNKVLVLDMDVADYDPVKVKAELALLYGVPEESISLAVSGGSVSISVTLSTSATSANPNGLSVEELTNAFNAVLDAALASGLGVSVTSTAPQQGTTVKKVSFTCVRLR